MKNEDYREATLLISSQRDQPLSEEQALLALYGLGLTGEAGEVSDEIKKILFHGKLMDETKLLTEIGDVVWYLDRILMFIGASFEDAMVANIEKLRKRYPEGWDQASKHFGWTAAEGA